VKVLDFGLAKAYAGEQAELNLSNSPTLSDMATQQGIILGTAAYMSPEQARGKPVDKRADIWAFGCVLYEMLTGRAAFSGRDVTEILAAVIRAEPEWKSLPANLHWRLREVLERCLEKEAKDRYSGINDARVEIQKALADPSGVLVQPVATMEPRTKMRTIIPWIAAALFLGLIIAGVAVWKLKPTKPHRVIRLDYELPEDQQFSNLNSHFLAVSPDGSQFVYSTTAGLYSRSLGEWKARFVPGTDQSPSQPFFSPDGKWIGYFSAADGQLKKIPASGGAPVALCPVANLASASWGADNTIVYGDFPNSIMRISASGGIPEPIFKTKEVVWVPQILPGGKSVQFSYVAAANGIGQIVVQSLKSKERKELFPGYTARYLPTGHIVYGFEGNLYAVPFNLDKLEVTGEAVPLVEDVFQTNSLLHYAISDSGTLVYVPGRIITTAALNQRTLVWVDRKGKETPIAVPPKDYRNPKISPDGTKVAFNASTGDKSDIWIWDLVRENLTRLTFNEASYIPVWTPDGRRIAFSLTRENKVAVYWKAADGTGEEELVASAPPFGAAFPWTWSSDGKTLVAVTAGQASSDIASLSMEGDRRWKPLLKEKYYELVPEISPDGKWMAYGSNESGEFEVYVCPFPEVNKGKWQVSIGGGRGPIWSHDGRELFYSNGDSMVAVAVQAEATFKWAKPEVLFRGRYTPDSQNNGHPSDISADGKRFLMMKDVVSTEKSAAVPHKINVVLNFLEELKQRVPIK